MQLSAHVFIGNTPNANSIDYTHRKQRKRQRIVNNSNDGIAAAGTLVHLLEIDGSRHTDPGFIYMLKEREFLKTRENVFKVGKTKEYKQRFASYPKHSHVLMMYFTSNMSVAERNLLTQLRSINCVTPRKDIGREYFECDETYLKRVFINVMTTDLKITPT